MPRPRATPVKFRPSGCSDAADGSNAPVGAMMQLANLVVDPAMAGCFVPRPAAQKVADLTAGITGATFVSGLVVVGDIAYGMVKSSRNVGFDEPFAFNLKTNTAITVSGVLSSNVPTSPAATGDWTPPILSFVGTRIIVTHPGFPGGTTKFGWFDVSGASIATTGTMTGGSAVITGNPSILAVQPGMLITGSNIAAGATVVSTTNFVLTQNGQTHGTTTLDGLASTDGIAIGQKVAGLGIPTATTVAAVGTGSVTLSAAATGSGIVSVTFTGTTITMSANASGSGSNTITIAGGSLSAPLWGAGDVDRNPLPSVPVGVAQYNGRAWYALGTNGVVFSDSGLPCRVSNTTAVQALTTNDGLAVTAVAPLMLSAPLVTTGIAQALIAFQGVSKMQQITGDESTADLAMNALPVATGTAAPLSITACEMGTAFISPEGLRFIQFNGTVSEPIGNAGEGITTPFIFAQYPSRICGAANAHTLRFTTTNAAEATPTAKEWWYDLGRKVWTGPMNFPASLIQPWEGQTKQNTFVMTPIGVTGSLWRADTQAYPTSSYTENGKNLTWAYQPLPLPDSGLAAMNALLEMALAGQFVVGFSVTGTAADITGLQLDTTQFPIAGGAGIWGSMIWGEDDWGVSTTVFQQWPIYWHKVLVFKQLSLTFAGQSAFGVRLENVYMKYEVLGYQLPVPPGLAA